MLSILIILKNKKILDVGCGTGFYSKYAIDKNAEVIAVDASQEMLDHLGKTNASPRLIMYKANLADGLPFIASTLLITLSAPLYYTILKIGNYY